MRRRRSTAARLALALLGGLCLLQLPGSIDAQRPSFFSALRSRRAGPSSTSSSSTSASSSQASPAAAAAPAAARGAGAGCGGAGGGPAWGLGAIGLEGAKLPASTSRVLVCLITSGVHTSSSALSHNRWTGCSFQDPLDPTGCTLPWSAAPGSSSDWRPRGTWLASIVAASPGSGLPGVIPGGADLHVVAVDGPTTGSVDPHSTASSGKSRLRAYSVCEGRLRGLQAQAQTAGDRGTPWRMVMLVDVAAPKPASSGAGSYAVSEADWVRTATGTGPAELQHAPDVLLVAPAGKGPEPAYPAAIPKVLGVGGVGCSGEPLPNAGGSGKPDLLAPGGQVPVPDASSPWSDNAAAAAYAAGAAARLWSAFPGCNADDVRAALVSGASAGATPRLNIAGAQAFLQKKCSR